MHPESWNERLVPDLALGLNAISRGKLLAGREGGTLGLDLRDSLRGISRLLVLDAVNTGATPGTLKRFEGQRVDDLPVSKSVHLLGFSDLMSALRMIDAAAAEVLLLGVQPASTEWGTILTAEVETARYDLMQAALDQLAQWKV